MFDYDKWQEIFGMIRKNKLRTALTMLGVSWGVFMLIILLGAGKGLQNGATSQFSGWASNAGFVWPQRTTMPYNGYQPGRRPQFDTDDIIAIKQNVEGLEYLAPRNRLGGFMGGNNVARKDKAGAFSVNGDFPEYQKINKVNLYKGRHLNINDINENRKIAVIGSGVEEILFKPDEDPVGQYIKINGVYFNVVGVFKSNQEGGEADRDNQSVTVPFSTFQKAFNNGNKVSWFGFTAAPNISVSKVEAQIMDALKSRHNIHPTDRGALGHNNLEEDFLKFSGLFAGISVFTWFVGICTLLAGIIGVSNIMLIVVKERTREIGIRKALGATPRSIIGLILQEAVVITFLAGYLGLFFGILLTEGIAGFIASGGGIMGPPEVDYKIALSALVILVFGGILAGLIPARKAARISPVEAIRNE